MRSYKFLFLSLLVFVICGCVNSKSEKTDLMYEFGSQKVEIQILNGNDFLEYDMPTRTNFELTNIGSGKFSVSGAGIRVLGSDEGLMKTEIIVPKSYLEKDTLSIKVRFGDLPEQNHEFYIPMKTAE